MTLSIVFGLCFLGSCGTDDPPPARGSEGPVSDDPAVLAAFEVCYEEMSAEVLADNPDTPLELRPALVKGAYLACESAVVQTCERGKDTQSCQLMLETYAN